MSERFTTLYREACDLAFGLGAERCGCNVIRVADAEVCRASATFADGMSVTGDHPDHEVAMGGLVESLKAMATASRHEGAKP